MRLETFRRVAVSGVVLMNMIKTARTARSDCASSAATGRFGLLLLLIIILGRGLIGPPQVEAAPPQAQVLLSFFDQLCQGEWYGGFSGAPFPEWPKKLPCPGAPGDNNGFVRHLSSSDKLENGQDGARTIETYPTMQPDGFIRGTFDFNRLGVTLQSGDHFKAKVGFVEGMTEARARFILIYDPDPVESGDEKTLFDTRKSYNKNLVSVDVDLSAYAGQRGNLILRVETEGPYTQDRAVWVNPRIDRLEPPSPPPQPTTAVPSSETPTNTPKPKSTTAVPRTGSPTPTPSPTRPPTRDCSGTTLTLVADPPAPFENQRVRFNAAAAPGCDLAELTLWVNGEPLQTCQGSKCQGEGGPYPDGVDLFEALGRDEQGNPVFPGNIYVQGESMSIDYGAIGDFELCPLCPEVIGLGPCVSQTCSGPSSPDYDVRSEVEISCEYQNAVQLEFAFDTSAFDSMFDDDTPGAYEDRCTSDQDLLEFYCQGLSVTQESYSCPFLCDDGACLPCAESDGGYRIWEYGVVENDPLGRADYCASTTLLHEYYCSGGELREKDNGCNFCENGACQHCEDTDGGINPWEYGVTYGGQEDYCINGDWLAETYNELTPTGCYTMYYSYKCPAGCNASIRACNATCSDGIQNGMETGVDCGGNCPASCKDCNWWGPNPMGGGDEAGRFSLNDPIVLSTAIDAMMEYADCLRDPLCRATLPWQASSLFKGNYDEITAGDITNDPNAMMEAVAFYVTEHMGYVLDDNRPSGVPEIQSAAYTIQTSGNRGCTADKATTPGHANQLADYCGDCEDHAILRAALLRSLGIPRDCVFCADYYEGYWGGGHAFNLVHYRGKWRIMDYHVLGWYFNDRWSAHVVGNVWNDYYGEHWCPDWKDNLGDGHLDAGCSRRHPENYTQNYFSGPICPPPYEIEIMGMRILIDYSQDTFYADTCP